MEWPLADAKNRFSELVTRALSEGPQRVHRHKYTVVIVSEREYDKLTGSRPDFKKFLIGPGPSFEGLNITRQRLWPESHRGGSFNGLHLDRVSQGRCLNSFYPAGRRRTRLPSSTKER